ncbi:uncharacterized protein LOC125825370 [Solanum verrucosum]|uniref:uncharacterized protein LOC125825370 n=1 Tax=Solanum verrucosum TaxID=315347 RepID=UPI0020D117CB|nr:uncharacterized protein LOC125825370 [Solanum verrucosum]
MEKFQDTLADAWEKCDAIVHSWIMNSVSKHLLSGIVYGSSASAVWEDLKERFNKINRVRVFQLHREITNHTQGTNSVSTYYSKHKELWDEYNTIISTPKCDCPKSKEYDDHLQDQRLLQFLNGLNDSFDQTRRQILMKSIAPTDRLHDPTILQAGRDPGYRGKRPILRCEHCHMRGHTKEQCWKIIGYPDAFKPRGRYNSRGGSGNQNANNQHSAGTSIHDSHFTRGKASGDANGQYFTETQYQQILHMLSKDFADGQQATNSSGTITCFHSYIPHSEWIVDSGATHHITASLENLLKYEEVENSSNDKIYLPIGGKDLFSGKVRGIGKEKCGLYIFRSGGERHMKQINKYSTGINMTATMDTTSGSYHTWASIFVSHEMDTYSNLWGPYKTATLNKKSYFLTIVDDHSRFTWVFLLQFKSDVIVVLQDFLSMIKTQFDAAIKVIRSANGTEFFNSKCNELLNQHGIVHQSSCVHTPQQNGRVERKHKQILDTARALRFQADIPIRYWGLCVKATVYLINRLPSIVLQGHTPYEVLYKMKNHIDHLRVFGCLCYATNLVKHDKDVQFRETTFPFRNKISAVTQENHMLVEHELVQFSPLTTVPNDHVSVEPAEPIESGGAVILETQDVAIHGIASQELVANNTQDTDVMTVEHVFVDDDTYDNAMIEAQA